MKKFLSVLLILTLGILSSTCVFAADEDVVLTITPNLTSAEVSDEEIKVMYTIQITPKTGIEVGNFAFTFNVPENMTLATGQIGTKGGENGFWLNRSELLYDSLDRPDALFGICEYTEKSKYFCASNSDAERGYISSRTYDVMTIEATIAAGESGNFTLGATFDAGNTLGYDYSNVRVDSIPVVVSKAPIETVAITELSEPVKYNVPDTEITVTPTLTALVEWYKGETKFEDAKFEAKTVYTAKIKLTATSDERFANVVTAEGYSVSRVDDKNIILSKTFDKTEDLAILGGTVSISGTPKIGETLTVDTSLLDYKEESVGTLSYKWYRGETEIVGATELTYVCQVADVGSQISVEVSNSNNTGSIKSTATVEVEKKDAPAAPDAPAVNSFTDTTIKVNAVPGVTYSLEDGSMENEIGEFTGLIPNRKYKIVAFIKETTDTKPSARSTETSQITDKANQIITVTSNTHSLKFGKTLDLNDICSSNASNATITYTLDGTLPTGTTVNTSTITAGNTTGSFNIKINSVEVGDYKAAAEQIITIKIVEKDTQVFATGFNTAVNKIYGDENFTKTISLTSGDGEITYSSDQESVATVNANGEVTTLKPGTTIITATAAETVEFAEATVSYTLTVEAKEISVKAGNYKVSKIYDGTTAVGTISGNLVVSGILEGDNEVTVEATPVAYANKNVGTATMNVTLQITGDVDGKYRLTNSAVTVPCEITKRTLEITGATVTSKKYDGNTTATVETVTFNNLQNSETLEKDVDYTVVGVYNSANVKEANKVTVTVTLLNTEKAKNYQIAGTFDKTGESIAKADSPAVPTVEGSYTFSTVDTTKFVYTVKTISGAEYKMDDGNYQDSNKFDNIVPESSHTFYARIKETDNVNVGEVGNTELITFVKLQNTNVPTLSFEVSGDSGNCMITITEVEGAEYSFDNGLTFGTANKKTGINNKTVQIAIRYKETVTYLASNAATATVNTMKENKEAPNAFELTFVLNSDGATYTATIPAVENGLYSFDGTTYSNVNTKVDCLPNTEYTGYVKFAETATHNESSVTSNTKTTLKLQVKAPTMTPAGGSYTANQTVTITTLTEGAEIYYTTNGITPNAESTKYTAPFEVSLGTTVKVIAIKDGMRDSVVVSATYSRKTAGGGASSSTTKKEEEVIEETWKNPFTDVTEDNWYYEAVKFANENKLFNGISSTEFGANISMTRGMLVTVLYRLEEEPATNKSIPFADVDMSMYYANAVIWAKQNNIVNGINENNFAPDAQVTREQLTTILYRYAKATGKGVSVNESQNIVSYDDANQVSEYAMTALEWAVENGIVTGRTKSTLDPLGTTTRAEVATMLMRYIIKNS